MIPTTNTIMSGSLKNSEPAWWVSRQSPRCPECRRAKIDGKDVFMASKVKKGNFFEFKVRLTATGKPFWTLTPEELVREEAPESE